MAKIEREPIIDIDEVTTIGKSRISTKQVQLPPNFGDVLYVDIGYGCNAGINCICYSLFVVDKATRYKLIYGLISLKYNILPDIPQLIKDIGHTPEKIIKDYNHKIMGTNVSSYLENLNYNLESASP